MKLPAGYKQLKRNKPWQVSGVISNSLLTTLALFIVRASNTICFLIIIWYLGEKEAGTYALTLSYALFFAQLAFWGLDQLLIREISLQKDDIGDIIGFFFLIRIIITFFCFFLLVFFIFSQNHQYTTRSCLIIGSTIVISESLTKFCQTVFSAYERSKYSVFMSITSGILKLLGIILIIVTGYINVVSFITVIAVTSTVSLVVGLFHIFMLFDRPKLRNTRYLWDRYYKSSLPFVAISFATTIEFQADTLLLSRLLDTNIEIKIGLYNAITLILYTLLMGTQGLRSALLPGISRAFIQDQLILGALFQQIFKMLLIFTLPIALTISWFSSNVVHIVYGSKFPQATEGIQIIIWSFVFLTSVLPATTILIILDKRRLLLIIQIFSTLINIVLNIILIPRIGVQGAVWSRLFSSFIGWLFSIISICKVIDLNINYRVIVKILLTLVAMGIFIELMYTYLHIYWILTALCSIILYAFFIVKTRCINQNDLHLFRKSAK